MAGCSSLFAFLVSSYCFAALPHDAKGLSEVCDCVFPDHTHFLLLYEENLARLGLISFFVAKQQATSLSIK